MDCLNVRIREGKIVRDNMGWGAFPNSDDAIVLSDPCTGIDAFFPQAGGQLLLFLSTKDVYLYDEATSTVSFLTPRYSTGDVDVTLGSPTVSGNGTAFTTNVKAGDRIHIGNADEDDPTETWYEVLSVTNDTTLTLTTNYAGTTATAKDYTVRQCFTGDIDDYWSFETFPAAEAVSGSDGDRWYATNGIDPVIAWDGADDEVYLPNIGLDTCKSLMRYKNMMLYVNITESSVFKPFSIRNSAIAEPENTSTKEAAEYVIHDGTDPLLKALPLGDNAIFYGTRSITVGQFVGGDLGFIFRTAVSGLGILAGRGIADFGSYHKFLGSDSMYDFDGITTREDGEHVFRDVIRRHSPQRPDLIQTHFDEENGELIWVVPLNSDAEPEDGPPETAFVQHYLELVSERDQTPVTIRQLPSLCFGYFSREDTLTFDQLQGTWEEQNYRWNDQFFQGAFPFNLFGSITGEIFILNERDSQNGTAITSYARFGRLPLGDIKTKGTIMRVYPFAERINGNLTVNLYMTDAPAGSTTLNGTYQYDMAGTKHFVSPRRTGRFVEVEYRAEGVSRPFFIQGYDLDIVRAGQR